MFLQDLGNGQTAPLDPTQGVKEEIAIEGSLPFLCPHVDLLLVVREGAVIPVLTVLLVKHIYKATNITTTHGVEAGIRNKALLLTLILFPSLSHHPELLFF